MSNAILTKEASHALAVMVTVYIRGSDGSPVGILGVNYSLESIRSYSFNAGRALGITLQVTDHLGTSLTAGGSHGLVSLAADPRVRAALAGRTGLLSNYVPVLRSGGHGPSGCTVRPGNGNRWPGNDSRWGPPEGEAVGW